MMSPCRRLYDVDRSFVDIAAKHSLGPETGALLILVVIETKRTRSRDPSLSSDNSDCGREKKKKNQIKSFLPRDAP